MQGSITPQGAKNEALEVISAVLLTAEPVRISNVPEILDGVISGASRLTMPSSTCSNC